MKDYPFIIDEAEYERLRRQNIFFESLTEKFFTGMELLPGMRVLDVGCGTGHVSAVVKQIIKSGEIVGIDLDEDSLAMARGAVIPTSDLSVEFVRTSLADYSPEKKFDAVVGRVVLMYADDPTAELRWAKNLVNRPGGRVGFLEADHRLYCKPDSDSALFANYRALIDRTAAACGIHQSLGLRLCSHFIDAGFVKMTVAVYHSDQKPNHPDIFARWAATYCGMRRWLNRTAGGFPPEDPEIVQVEMATDVRTGRTKARPSPLIGVFAEVP